MKSAQIFVGVCLLRFTSESASVHWFLDLSKKARKFKEKKYNTKDNIRKREAANIDWKWEWE